MGAIQAYVAASTKKDRETQYKPAEKNPRPNHQPAENASQEAEIVNFEYGNFFGLRLPSISQINPTNPGTNNGQAYRGGSANAVTIPNKIAKHLLAHPFRDITRPRSCSNLTINLLVRKINLRLRTKLALPISGHTSQEQSHVYAIF